MPAKDLTALIRKDANRRVPIFEVMKKAFISEVGKDLSWIDGFDRGLRHLLLDNAGYTAARLILPASFPQVQGRKRQRYSGLFSRVIRLLG